MKGAAALCSAIACCNEEASTACKAQMPEAAACSASMHRHHVHTMLQYGAPLPARFSDAQCARACHAPQCIEQVLSGGLNPSKTPLPHQQQYLSAGIMSHRCPLLYWQTTARYAQIEHRMAYYYPTIHNGCLHTPRMHNTEAGHSAAMHQGTHFAHLAHPVSVNRHIFCSTYTQVRPAACANTDLCASFCCWAAYAVVATMQQGTLSHQATLVFIQR